MDFNTELQQLFKDSNILFHKEMEEKEHEYYTVVFHKKNNEYYTPSSHPILKTLPLKLSDKDGMIILEPFEFQIIKEMLKLEQANVIVRIID